MKTSLNNTRLIEQFLEENLSPVNKFLFETRLLVNPELRHTLYFQKKTYSLVKMYHRQKMREELELLHQRLFNDPSGFEFQQKIFKLFNI